MTVTTATPASSSTRRSLILLSCMLTVTLYFTTIMVVSTVLPQIQGTMSATADEVSWVVTFNILAIAIATPMTGWLVARFGKRNTMCTCTAGFTIATVVCSVAPSLESLIVWRILQGALGAPTVPLAQTILLDTFPKSQHRFVLGAFGMGVVIGPIIGPTLSGYLAETYTWRWAFYMLIPVGAAAFFGLLSTLPRDDRSGTARLDWIGFLSLSMAIGALQLVLARGQRLDWFESEEIVIAAVVSAISLYIFLAHSITAERPFLNLRLLANRNLALGYLLVAIFGMLNFTPMVLLPTLLRQYADYPDALVGLVVGSRGIGGLMGFFAAMYIERIDPRISMAAGFLLLVISGFWLMHVNLDVTALELSLNGILQGLSVGIIWVPLSIATFSDLDPKVRPEASGVFHLLRNMAASLFISISVAVTVRSTGINYARLTEMITPYNEVIALPWVRGAWEFATEPGLARIAKEITKQSAMIAYTNTFGLFTLVSAIAIPLALLMSPPQPDNRAST